MLVIVISMSLQGRLEVLHTDSSWERSLNSSINEFETIRIFMNEEDNLLECKMA